MSRLRGFVRLIRPPNCLMMGFAVIVGAVLVSRDILGIPWLNLVYGFITGFMLTAASMVINDYYDRDIDAVNEPNRPIPSGLIKPNEAFAFALILTAVGFSAAYLTNTVYPLCLVTAAIAWIVFVVYTTIGKKTGFLGNLLVSACVAVPFIYASIIVVNTIELNVLTFATMAFFSNTGREITKGIVDVKGDESKHVKTLAVRYGERKAAIAATWFYLSAVALSPLPWLMNLVSIWFIPFAAVTDLGLIILSVILLRNYSRESARKVKKNVLLWFTTGLLAFVLGTLR